MSDYEKKTALMAFKDFAAKDWQGSILIVLLLSYAALCTILVATYRSEQIEYVTTAYKDLMLTAIGYYFGSKAVKDHE